MFKLLLCDLNQELVDAWERSFIDLPEVSFVCGPFEEQEFDCMVSAANSFGFMDGGIDGAITRYFGQQLMDRVQETILMWYAGEQPVGTSIIVETEHEDKPWLAHTPTMRIPQDVSDTDNVYNAMRGMLLAVQQHNRNCDAIKDTENRIDVVCCPGLGTLTGRVSADSAADQMSLAYRQVMNPPSKADWGHAMRTHANLLRAING